MGNNWIQRSYKHIGKYFDCASINEYYNSLKESGENIIHVHSMYSIFDSTQTPDEICERVKELGGKNVTLTDHGTLLGIEPFMKSGEKYGINTIPGVETYITMTPEDISEVFHTELVPNAYTRNHMIVFARNHKGFVDISHAMREANTHLVSVTKKISNALMTKEICEEYFKDNTDVVVTTACIQGIVGYILLQNMKQKSKAEKILKKADTYKSDYEEYKEKSKIFNELKKEYAEIKKEKTKYTKYASDTFEEKLVALRDKCDTLLPGEKKYKATIEKYQNQLQLNKNAKMALEKINVQIEEKETQIAKYKPIISELKKSTTKYEKLIKSIQAIKDEFVSDEELYELAKKQLEWYKNTFPICFVELQYHGLEEEAYAMPILVKLARELDIPLIAANDAHMKDNSDDSIEARRIVRYNYFEKAQEISDADKELYIKSDSELAESLMKVIDKDACYEAIFNTRILETCKVIFPNEKHYPSVNSEVDFVEMVLKGKEKRLKDGTIEKWTSVYDERLNHELKTMKDMGYVDYHKVVEDFCKEGRILGRIPKSEIENIPNDYSKVHAWIEENNFPNGVGIGDGRGSGVGSLVCCCLGITNLDPIKYGLLFERFLNPERISMPDIDTDIATRIRPTMIKYLKWKYGEKSVCSIATETTYAAKAAIQMAGRDRSSVLYGKEPKKICDAKRKAYMYKYTLVLSDLIPKTPNITLADCEEDVKMYLKDEEMNIIWNHAKLLEGKLQGTGVHAGGVIISDNDNVNDYIPLAYNMEKDVWAAQCDMVVAEEKGLLKMDLLGLSTLDCLSDCMYYVRQYRGEEINFSNIPFEEEVFENIYASGNTNSVFQVESPGMKDMLKRFKPTCFEDIILLVACYRPGPMQYLEDIIKVKNKEKELTYKTPELESILCTTYGAVVYQEQVMEIFQKLAGYSLGGADLVRRAMSKKKTKVLEKERQSFIYGDTDRNIDGCKKRGIDEKVANELFDEMMEFAKYAFNKSHAAAYAKTSYNTAWCKYHYPSEFLCAMFNNKDQDDFAPIIEDCEYYGIKILNPDVNKSFFDFTLDGDNIQYGIGGIRGIGEKNRDVFKKMCENRTQRPYNSIKDFLARNESISSSIFIALVNSGFFDSLGYDRQKLFEFINDASNEVSNFLKSEVADDEFKGQTPLSYVIQNEINCLSVLLSRNPLSEYQEDKKYKCTPISELKEGEDEEIFGFVLSIEEKKNKYGDNIYVINLQGKMGNCLVYTNKYIYYQYKKEDLLYKVIKCSGRWIYGKLFAKSISLLNPNTYEYYIDLRTKNDTESVCKILNAENREDGDVCIRIICHWVMNNGILCETNRPMIAERWMTNQELKNLQQMNVKIEKS